MSSTDELLAEIDREDEPSTSESSSQRSRSAPRGDSRRDRVASRAQKLFSPRAFVIALVLTVGGLLVGGLIPLGFLGTLLGVFGAAFAFGLVASERRYAETALATGGVVALSVLLEYAVITFVGGLGSGLGLGLVAAAIGGAVGLVGHYFGRDLRAGVTQDL